VLGAPAAFNLSMPVTLSDCGPGGNAFMPLMVDQQVGFSHVISCGNQVGHQLGTRPSTSCRTQRLPFSGDCGIAAHRTIGQSAAVKAQVRGLLHKSDIGGVKLNCDTEETVTDAYRTVLIRSLDLDPIVIGRRGEGVIAVDIAAEPSTAA
jgi:hypothetical protein